ncbi:2-hydroxychromene-2-carboxylate isomerase [Albimonas sp. CAU 1670]|uniref:2-hydroxychromene-2-carboxylate isomerase n=1 Tax=Albimonas sp. CAU 1670 TaxID=3032599 RepID=UPI0023DB573A|nr:2-hydroxychromene-2-carboxylate isomerase [Albimonas sp. CAU 1670]MDF2231355.1 2-hydroxychromene-2-carboxylate isomerase [Albimonas sp. CAU 1670]
MTRPVLTFWFEFASTYTHLAVQRAEALAEARGVALAWTPILLGPIFAAQGWTTSPFNQLPVKGANMWRDMERQAAKLGLPPVVRPEPFPQNSLLAARVATALPPEARPGFAREVFLAEFARGETISDPQVVSAALAACGLPAEETLARAADPETKAALRAATEAAQAAGVFGAPSFTTPDGELFWGNDRLEDALDWAVERA